MLSSGRKPLSYFPLFTGEKIVEARVGTLPFLPGRGLREAPWPEVNRVIGVSVKVEFSLAGGNRKRVLAIFKPSSQTDSWGR